MTSAPDAVLCENSRCLDGLEDDVAVGDDRHVAPLDHHVAASHAEGIARLVEVEDGIPHESHENRPRCLQGHIEELLGRPGVGRHEDLHVGQRRHVCDVFRGLVGHAVDGRCEAAVRREELHVEVRVTDKGPDRFQGPHGDENTVARGDDRAAVGRHAGGGAHHVALGDAHVEIAFGVLVPEQVGEGGIADVGLEDDEFAVDGAVLRHPFGESPPGGYRCGCHGIRSHESSPQISFMAQLS